MIAQFLLRSAISGTFAMILYIIAGSIFAKFFGRNVSRSVLRRDFKLGLISLASGSPMLQLFAMLSEKYHFGRMYMNISDHGWLYWLISLPLYVLCWDAVFYLTHLVLHWPWVYRNSHFRHHSCRPPVPWSGIAIDPLETILSGIMPYTIPLFFFPFHIYTVYALNIALMFWATMVHSALPWTQSAIWMTPKDHNLHHAFGLKNYNFAAVFTFWDRLGNTLNRRQDPPWWGKESWTPRAHKSAAAPAPVLVPSPEFVPELPDLPHQPTSQP